MTATSWIEGGYCLRCKSIQKVRKGTGLCAPCDKAYKKRTEVQR